MSSSIECEGLVEGVTDYLEGALNDAEMHRVADHLQVCWSCVNYVGEMKVTIRLMSELPAEPLSGELESNLLGMFRDWATRV